MYDLLLKNGRIYDGSGMPSFVADLAIRDGRIAAIGRIDEAATRVLNADGLAVAPGIIDFHTHFDAQIWWDPLGSSSNEHGVHCCLRQLRPDFGSMQAGESRCTDRYLRAGGEHAAQ